MQGSEGKGFIPCQENDRGTQGEKELMAAILEIAITIGYFTQISIFIVFLHIICIYVDA